jgi:hypothetical protein
MSFHQTFHVAVGERSRNRPLRCAARTLTARSEVPLQAVGPRRVHEKNVSPSSVAAGQLDRLGVQFVPRHLSEP